MKKMLVLTFILFCSTGSVFSATFTTWDGFEADKLASIWLIKRFISPDAKIVLYPKGQVIDTGIQFDTPYSKIRRRFNQSTFESLLEHYKVADQKLYNIGRLIHDMEINVWEKKIFHKTRKMTFFFIDLLNGSLEDQVILMEAGSFFDRLYKELPDNLKLNQGS